MSEQDKTPEETAENDPETPQQDAPTDATALDDAAPENEDKPVAQEQASDPAAEIATLNDKLLRTLAEGENLRRRAQREREDTAKFAITNFARDILSVADNLQRALASLPETPPDAEDAINAFADGVKLTERELQSIFERHGIEKIDPQGQKFDHDRHEAMFEMPTADAPAGTVVQVFEVGYLLKDRLLRAAKVAVAKALPAPDESERVDTKV
ncbi:MAG: nucleotide exchange factor GrpE [Pseudomonadota bacterium]|nr:nucleotide exchange factor GrpE [Pseudomonadota bacterium]